MIPRPGWLELRVELLSRTLIKTSYLPIRAVMKCRSNIDIITLILVRSMTFWFKYNLGLK